MRLLIKGAGDQGVAAHIPSVDGMPLCRTQLNLVHWHLADQRKQNVVICYHCKRAQAKSLPEADKRRVTSDE